MSLVEHTRISVASSAPDRHTARQAFGAFPTGVTVLAVGEPRPHGMTVSSFTSVSLDPARVLVCVDHSTVMHSRIIDADCFSISVLADHHENLARHFSDSSRPTGSAQFELGVWRNGPITGAPLLERAAATFECRRESAYVAGDHSIIVGQVLALARGPEDSPLLYSHGKLSQWNQHHPGPQLGDTSA